MSTALLTVIGAVSVAVISSLLAPIIIARLKGKADLQVAEREEWRAERRERDDIRQAELRSLKLENRTLNEAHDDLARRCAETEQKVTVLATRVESQEAVIVKQNGKISERDTEIANLKAQIVDLRNELLEAYRRITNVQRVVDGGGTS